MLKRRGFRTFKLWNTVSDSSQWLGSKMWTYVFYSGDWADQWVPKTNHVFITEVILIVMLMCCFERHWWTTYFVVSENLLNKSFHIYSRPLSLSESPATLRTSLTWGWAPYSWLWDKWRNDCDSAGLYFDHVENKLSPCSRNLTFS